MPLKIDQPGTMFGPCVECKHPACKRKRLMTLLPCPICHEHIGYDNPYLLSMEDGEPVHLSCVEAQEAEVAKAVQR